MNPDTPTFAVVGSVNHGKSSVVSTLAEDDKVIISARGGVTTENKPFSLRDRFIFYDTPGFQNANDVLAELRAAGRSDDLLQFFRDFSKKHGGDAAFQAECHILKLIAEGAGILYVVDGSQPVHDKNLEEMEILSRSGRPRVAVINRTNADNHVQSWKQQLGPHFNAAIQEFNAHQASFDDRIKLLEMLAANEERWKPNLIDAIRILREDLEIRRSDCAEIIVELLIDCLTHEETRLLDSDDEARRSRLERELREQFQNWISRREAEAHRAILEQFQHRLVTSKETANGLFDEGLFSETTWTLFGLSVKQLIAVGAITGAAIGAGGDLLFVGHSLGAFAAGGAAIGATGAYLTGKKRPEIDVEFQLPIKVPFFSRNRKIKTGGTTLRIPPYPAVGFPFILIDRALAVYHHATHRAHAQRDAVEIDSTAEKERMAKAGVSTEKWKDLRECQRHIVSIRKHKLTPNGLRELRKLLRAHLVEAATRKT